MATKLSLLFSIKNSKNEERAALVFEVLGGVGADGGGLALALVLAGQLALDLLEGLALRLWHDEEGEGDGRHQHGREEPEGGVGAEHLGYYREELRHHEHTRPVEQTCDR